MFPSEARFSFSPDLVVVIHISGIPFRKRRFNFTICEIDVNSTYERMQFRPTFMAICYVNKKDANTFSAKCKQKQTQHKMENGLGR
jgi:hypothetical protein